jgi:hypothetical protein
MSAFVTPPRLLGGGQAVGLVMDRDGLDSGVGAWSVDRVLFTKHPRWVFCTANITENPIYAPS